MLIIEDNTPVISELLGDVLQHRPKETGGFDSIIVVDGIPQVAKEEKK